MTATVVYRFFDAQGALLYVGVSENVKQRWVVHGSTKPWWPEVAEKTTEVFPSRDEALEAERAAIVAEKPKYNIVHAMSEQQEAALEEVVQAFVDAQAAELASWCVISSLREAGIPDLAICAETGISRATLNRKLGSRKAATA